MITKSDNLAQAVKTQLGKLLVAKVQETMTPEQITLINNQQVQVNIKRNELIRAQQNLKSELVDIVRQNFNQ